MEVPNFYFLGTWPDYTEEYKYFDTFPAILPDQDLVPNGDQPKPTKKKKLRIKKEEFPRRKYTTDQLSQLEQAYQNNNFIKLPLRKELSEATGLTEKQVKVWFQNRRARDRRMVKQAQEMEDKWNRYLMDLMQSTTQSFYYQMDHLVPIEQTQYTQACPHEYFHSTTMKCPCAT